MLPPGEDAHYRRFGPGLKRPPCLWVCLSLGSSMPHLSPQTQQDKGLTCKSPEESHQTQLMARGSIPWANATNCPQGPWHPQVNSTSRTGIFFHLLSPMVNPPHLSRPTPGQLLLSSPCPEERSAHVPCIDVYGNSTILVFKLFSGLLPTHHWAPWGQGSHLLHLGIHKA